MPIIIPNCSRGSQDSDSRQHGAGVGTEIVKLGQTESVNTTVLSDVCPGPVYS